MLVSFIIPHKGREELLERTIQAIFDLKFDLKEIEIIVVTQNKTLECPYVARNKLHFKIVFRPEHDTISSLRNAGVERASGEHLVFLDADIQLSPNWLNTMFSELKVKPERALISAVQQARPNAGVIEKIRVVLNNTSADSAVQFLGAANLFMNRKTFHDVGGFPEHLITCEDYYFTNMAHQIGEVYRTSKASFIHLGEDKNYREMFRKEIWRGKANLQSIQGRKIFLRETPSILIPFWEVLFFLGAVILGFLGKMGFAFFCLVLFCLPIILYAIRLYRIGRQNISFTDALCYYSVYFSTRTIGTVMGIFKVIKI